MGHLADIYVIKKSRSKQLGIDFLNQFLPLNSESADEYSIPQYSVSPVQNFDKAHDLMTYLESNNQYAQSIYWQNLNKQDRNKHGMIFYTEDGCMIFGISRYVDSRKDEKEFLKGMKYFFHAEMGYIDHENPPVDSYEEFIERVKQLE
ncbi:hypothetical protein [Lishizhenia sp.]|uniref:hypothetical protein n=1 Tax=Lishizhenia sp. TaxID=2497594 RepID=UPI00299EC9FC|nr:hypothetical protein [Lishizhenia sp.]MDX1447173.1 hypothetical protein [Lishizhenia sp.]